MKTLHLTRRKEVVEDTGLELPIYLKIPQDSLGIDNVYYKVWHDGSSWETIRVDRWHDGGSVQRESADLVAPNIYIPELPCSLEQLVVPKEEFDSVFRWALDFVNPD